MKVAYIPFHAILALDNEKTDLILKNYEVITQLILDPEKNISYEDIFQLDIDELLVIIEDPDSIQSKEILYSSIPSCFTM